MRGLYCHLKGPSGCSNKHLSSLLESEQYLQGRSSCSESKPASMSVAISFENGYSNGVNFFTPIEGKSSEDVVAAVASMKESFKAIPVALGGAILKSTDGNSVASYEMWVKDADLGDYHEQLNPLLESVEAVAETNPNFFEPMVADAKPGVKHEFEKDAVFGIQVLSLEAEQWERIFSECHAAMKKRLDSLDGLDSYVIFRSWDVSKLMVLTKWSSLEGSKALAGLLDSSLEALCTSKDVDNCYQVV